MATLALNELNVFPGRGFSRCFCEMKEKRREYTYKLSYEFKSHKILTTQDTFPALLLEHWALAMHGILPLHPHVQVSGTGLGH